MFRTYLLGVVIAVVVIVAAHVGVGIATANATGTVTRYDARDGNGPTVVIRGAFASAEDMTTLKLVAYDPANDRVVYRVVTP